MKTTDFLYHQFFVLTSYLYSVILTDVYYNLFIDDERNPENVAWVKLPPVQWVVVKNYDDFVKVITENGMPARISFDHDLAKEHYQDVIENRPPQYDQHKEKTGYQCAKWLVEYCLERKMGLPEYFIHTLNPIGRQNIQSLLDSYQKVCDNESVQ